jgi:hypothetical protein
MIPQGKYRARGCEATLARTSEGKPQVAVDLVITEEGEAEGQHRTWYGSFSDKARERTFESLCLLGWDGDNLSELGGIDRNDVWVTIVHEEDLEGNPRDRAAFINGSPGLAVKEPMGADDAKAFAEQMRGFVLAHKAKTRGAPASTKPAAANSGVKKAKKAPTPAEPKQNDFAPEGADDDIPF